MSINNQTLEQLEYLISKLQRRFPASDEDKVMTDISFQAKSETGELNVLNDDDEIVATTVIPDWIGYTGDDFTKVVTGILKEFITSQKNALEELAILHPYSILLVDDDKETLNEIYEVDDESIVIDHEELMEGLSQDLDNFIDNLLKE